jgi:hypothetical protein
MLDPYIHAMYSDETYTFCGLDFSGAEFVDEPDEPVTCQKCIDSGKVPKDKIGVIKELCLV